MTNTLKEKKGVTSAKTFFEEVIYEYSQMKLTAGLDAMTANVLLQKKELKPSSYPKATLMRGAQTYDLLERYNTSFEEFGNCLNEIQEEFDEYISNLGFRIIHTKISLHARSHDENLYAASIAFVALPPEDKIASIALRRKFTEWFFHKVFHNRESLMSFPDEEWETIIPLLELSHSKDKTMSDDDWAKLEKFLEKHSQELLEEIEETEN